MPRYESLPEFIRNMPEVDLPIAGADGWLLQGDGRQVVFASFADTVDVPEHAHAEQWEFVVSGKVDLHIDGITISHQAGDNFFVPADVPHSARIHAGYRAVIVFNAGDRYEAKSGIGNL